MNTNRLRKGRKLVQRVPLGSGAGPGRNVAFASPQRAPPPLLPIAGHYDAYVQFFPALEFSDQQYSNDNNQRCSSPLHFPLSLRFCPLTADSGQAPQRRVLALTLAIAPNRQWFRQCPIPLGFTGFLCRYTPNTSHISPARSYDDSVR